MPALELACAAQVAACGAYVLGRGRAPKLALALAWALASAVLAARWTAHGFAQPPWLSCWETLVFGAWGLLSMQAIAEWKFRTQTAGFFCTALAAAMSGAAILGQERLASPAGAASAALDPIFRNPWAWVHLPSGIFGFGLFLLAAFFAVLGLIRARVRTDRFQCALAGLALLLVANVVRGLPEPGLAGTVAVAGLSFFLLVSAGGLWLESLDRRLFEERARRQPESAAPLGKGPAERGALKILLLLSFGIAFAGAAVSVFKGRHSITSYPFVGLAFLCTLAAASLWLTFRRSGVEERLPERENFDRWSYQASLYAFPWLTIHLVSGSVWAYDAWGSFWSWQPQQAWVAIAWFYLALILHLEHGKVSTAVVSCGGAVLVGIAVASCGAHGFWPAIP